MVWNMLKKQIFIVSIGMNCVSKRTVVSFNQKIKKNRCVIHGHCYLIKSALINNRNSRSKITELCVHWVSILSVALLDKEMKKSFNCFEILGGDRLT
jgi:CRISPR/Cas system CMR-associated protein Cmr3 (group 5 of RAMP superfamily)